MQYFPDRFVQREVKNLEITCPHSKAGCIWEGKFQEYETHVNICEHGPKPDILPFTATVSPTNSLSGELISMDSSDMQDSHHDHTQELLNHLGNHLPTQAPHNELGVDDSGPFSQPQGPGHHMWPHQQLADDLMNSASEAIDNIQNHLLQSFHEELRSKDEEIASLHTRVTKLEKQIRAKNAELEDCDFRLSLIENSNHDGTMIWKIPQFSQRRADAENGKYTSIFSLPFYSGRYGYKMCLRLYIMGDGIGKGTHLSLFFVVMHGEFDNILQWSFTHKVTFKLINQEGGRDIVDTFQPDPLSSSFRKPKSDMNIASGCPRFVSHTELERGGFIVDDTIFIKCMIDTSTIRHP